ncbi:hypothetical protein PHMEG_00018247 [Phytophthora megakarya]|uniref:Retrovirus-related Pol polyprotein from transposon TNT 1-94-like beta-barrel domain-containing protein n=1 Tax=Phytophthora megakarya TaxID=4795 RepID=A0A225VVT8_9STRA|nr:hypothetical protein PHMEG_00018247 [Phytophthora megakarya]
MARGGSGGREGGRGNYGGNRKNNNNKSFRRDEGGYDQSRRKETLIAVVSNVIAVTSLNTRNDSRPKHLQAEASLSVPIKAIGTVELRITDSKGQPQTLTLHDVLLAPKLQYNLLSVAAAVDDDFRFWLQTYYVYSPNRPPLLCQGDEIRYIEALPIRSISAAKGRSTTGKPTRPMLLHKRLGHPNIRFFSTI